MLYYIYVCVCVGMGWMADKKVNPTSIYTNFLDENHAVNIYYYIIIYILSLYNILLYISLYGCMHYSLLSLMRLYNHSFRNQVCT